MLSRTCLTYYYLFKQEVSFAHRFSVNILNNTFDHDDAKYYAFPKQSVKLLLLYK